MTIIGLKLDKGQINKDNADAGMKARGEGIADMLVRCVKDQQTTLKRFLVDIAALDQQGRKAFRLSVNKHLKNIRAHVNSAKGTPEEAAWATTGRSAGVRLSEAVTFSRACDAGYTPAFAEMPYHSCIGMARTFLQSESSTGPTVRRGRKATPVLDKVKQFLLKLEAAGELKHSQLKDVEILVHTMASVSAAKAAKIETPTLPMARQPLQTGSEAANAAIHRARSAQNDSQLRSAAAKGNDKQG